MSVTSAWRVITCGWSPSVCDVRTCSRIPPEKRRLLIVANNAPSSAVSCCAVVSKLSNALAHFHVDDNGRTPRLACVPKTDGLVNVPRLVENSANARKFASSETVCADSVAVQSPSIAVKLQPDI